MKQFLLMGLLFLIFPAYSMQTVSGTIAPTEKVVRLMADLRYESSAEKATQILGCIKENCTKHLQAVKEAQELCHSEMVQFHVHRALIAYLNMILTITSFTDYIAKARALQKDWRFRSFTIDLMLGEDLAD